ncbi:MAG TPA: LppX_LprAFG lipoprotein [Ktedonosporobacter sp.]|nr:LppX_LprAFG lipoprotein [Ktedonosporobacter sp.]
MDNYICRIVFLGLYVAREVNVMLSYSIFSHTVSLKEGHPTRCRSHRNGWISLRHFLFLSILCLVCFLLLTGCSLSVIHAESDSVPATHQLLLSLQKNFAEVRSFHVVMHVQNPGLAESGHVQIRSASGDVLVPDRVQARATIIMFEQPMTVDLISIDKTQYITDPITGRWRVARDILDPRVLTNSNQGIIAIITKMQGITPPSTDYIDGRPCWRISGWLAAKYVAFLGGGVPGDSQLQASSCLGKSDFLPYQITVTGWATHGDTLQTSRTFLFSKYNEDISISAPEL